MVQHAGNQPHEIIDSRRSTPSAESIWREAMLLRDFSRDEMAAARKRRAEAETARRDAEQAALQATHELCADLRSRARAELQKAKDILADAERLNADAESEAARLKRDARSEIERAKTIRADAEAYAARLETTAKEKAEAIIAEARASAAKVQEDMRRASEDEIGKLIADIELARAAAQEELETQRILTETARIKAFSPGLAAREAAQEPENEDDLFSDPVFEDVNAAVPTAAHSEHMPEEVHNGHMPDVVLPELEPMVVGDSEPVKEAPAQPARKRRRSRAKESVA